jgi:hypothetical protein
MVEHCKWVSLKPKLVIRTVLCWMLFIGIAACQPRTETVIPASPTTGESRTPGAPETPVSSPTSELALTSTPTTTPAPLTLLLAPPGSDAALIQAVEAVLAAPLANAGLNLQTTSGFAADKVTANLRLVIGLPPDPGMQALAAASPQVQFLAVGIPGLTPGENLTIIGPYGFAEDQRGFIAGVIAAMITPDWRVAVLSISDTIPGRASSQGFLNGAVYFCGLCNPYYGPIVDYPLSAELPEGAPLEEWQAAVNLLKEKAVQTVFVYPGIDRLEVYEMLAQAGMKIIGGGELPQAETEWVASVMAVPEAAVLEVLPDILAGQGGAVLPIPYVLQNVDEELFSIGRQQRALEILADVVQGFIDTGVDPVTGEKR